MAYPTVFFNLAAGNQPASLLDTMFNIVGGQGFIPCTAAGTNAITLTSNANYYAPAAYADNQGVIFRAVATSTGAVTVQLNALAFVKVYMSNLVQAGAGDIVNGSWYQCFFAAALDSGNGGFLVNNSTTAAGTAPLQGSYKNLLLTNVGAPSPNSQVTPTADELILENTTGGTVKITTFAPPVTNILNAGANGLDTGAVAVSTWYAWWAIYNSSTATAAGMFSASFTAPTMPAGYTYKARYGAFRTDAAGNLHRVRIANDEGQYVVSAATTTALPNMGNGIAGTFSTTAPAWAAISVANFVPVTARGIRLTVINGYNNFTVADIIVAPNALYAGPRTTNPPPIYIPGTVTGLCSSLLFTLEATTIQWASNTTGGAVFCMGWKDAI